MTQCKHILTMVFHLLLILLTVLAINTPNYSCTTAVISGRATPDGRPILWKHRDSSTFQNKLRYFDDGIYPYIGLINANDSTGAEIWAGTNSAGFSIMNSASYNLKKNETELADQEGKIMNMALQQCKTIRDFEALLDSSSHKRGVEANFGVIDAFGGAAYYETDDSSYAKFDANDPATSPFGYLIRTNFSFTRNIDEGYGYIRYQTTETLFYQAYAEKKLTHEFILRIADRNLYHSLTGTDLRKPPYVLSSNENDFTYFEDFINRYTSVSTIVVHGVAPGESVDLNTFWTILGFPLTSIAVPVWVAAGNELPTELIAPDSKPAPLCRKSLRLKLRCFPISRGSGTSYINRAVLFNQIGTGIQQILPEIEKGIFKIVNPKLIEWRLNGFKKTDALKMYKQFDEYIPRSFNREFGFK
ncbi:hypothetical protein JW960_13705 [candidate division KSB1 bacterium]|nr:hypothetical protein [candidate division KSB1 bacterium]